MLLCRHFERHCNLEEIGALKELLRKDNGYTYIPPKYGHHLGWAAFPIFCLLTNRLKGRDIKLMRSGLIASGASSPAKSMSKDVEASSADFPWYRPEQAATTQRRGVMALP